MEEPKERSGQINDRLRRHRMQRNWSQRDIAEQLDVSVVTVQRWEHGTQQPGLYYRTKLCALFDTSAEELGLIETTPSTRPTEDALPEARPVDQVIKEEAALWIVPYPRNIHFTGREDLLHMLEQRLVPPQVNTSVTVLTRLQAIKGLGGIGKTQIALEYVYRSHERGYYTHILWINAASAKTMLTSCTAIANFLPTLCTHTQEELDQHRLIMAIVSWLEVCEQPWLLVFDNADDLSLIQPYIPRRGNGSILLTTRVHAVGAIATSIEVENMSLTDGTRFLLKRAGCETLASVDDIKEASEIVEMLARFPLALDQAGSYIEETECRLSNYIQLYKHHRHKLLARRGIQSTGYPQSVATTWSLSFLLIEQISPAAAELLRLCTFLAPDHIPEELLTEGTPYWSPLLQQAVADPLSFDQLLETLLAFSLVKRQASEHMLSIHRLVQIILRDQMAPEEQRQYAQRVIKATYSMFPQQSYDVTTWTRCLRYLEQVEMCDDLILAYHLYVPEAVEVLERAAVYLRERASYASAERLFLHALDLRESLSKTQPTSAIDNQNKEMAITTKNLADVYRKQGKYAAAEPLYRRVVATLEEQAGPPHPKLASTLNGLAGLFFEQGRYIEAEPLYQRALAILVLQFGSQHSRTASAINRLASLYFELDRYTEAEALYQQALAILERQAVPQHLEIASAFSGLANLSCERGMYIEAEHLFQQALTIRKQHLGQNHPYVAYTLNCLASLYVEQDRYTEAELLYQQALAIRQQQLGHNHPYVAYALTGLANLYCEQGMYARAESLYQQALTIREQSLPSTHPDLFKTRQELAQLWRTRSTMHRTTKREHVSMARS